MTKLQRVGLVVDHPVRELDGALLVAHQLRSRGAEPFIVPMYNQGFDVPRLGLDALVMNYVRTANHELIRSYAGAGLDVYVLDTEGGILAQQGGNSPAAMAAALSASGIDKHLAGYFFWGPAVRDAFEGTTSLPSERLHVTGCPRFDFVAPRWRPMLDRQRSGYVLLNTSFTLVNPRFSTEKRGETVTMKKAGWDPGYVDKLYDDMVTIFDEYLDVVRRLSARLPAQQFLLRPHPFESVPTYEKAFARLPNVTIDPTGNVLAAIHNATAVVHLNCGTAIESLMLDKLPIQLEFLNTPLTSKHAVLPGRVSANATSFDDLVDQLSDLAGRVAAHPFAAMHDEHVRPFFFEKDGGAAARVAQVIVGRNQGRRWYSSVAAIKGSRPRPRPGQLASGLASLAVGSAATEALRSFVVPKRQGKLIDPTAANEVLSRIADVSQGRPAKAERAKSRAIGARLTSVAVR